MVVNGTTVIGTGWHHYTYVKHGKLHRIYLDAVLEIEVADYELASILPTALVHYLDNGPTGVAPYPRTTGVKMWEAALTSTEIAAEMADYAAVRAANLYLETHLAVATDLTDSSGNFHDWSVDVNEPGVPVTVANGPTVSMPTSVAVDAVDGLALSITTGLPSFERFTAMGWWRSIDETDETSLFRYANDDNAGGTPELSLNMTAGASRHLYLALLNGMTGLSPVVGSSLGGTVVTLEADDAETPFVATPSVTFGGVPATGETWISASRMTCVAPAHAAGSVDVVSTNPAGNVYTRVRAFTYSVPGQWALHRFDLKPRREQTS